MFRIVELTGGEMGIAKDLLFDEGVQTHDIQKGGKSISGNAG